MRRVHGRERRGELGYRADGCQGCLGQHRRSKRSGTAIGPGSSPGSSRSPTARQKAGHRSAGTTRSAHNQQPCFAPRVRRRNACTAEVG
ncbi:MAG: hypothetical protein P1P90_00560 [Patescibacteria group bacterium]|nr:hypothetical protein [Patescibacteria group bacterium]